MKQSRLRCWWQVARVDSHFALSHLTIKTFQSEVIELQVFEHRACKRCIEWWCEQQHFIRRCYTWLWYNIPECLELGKGYLCIWFKKVTHSDYRSAFFRNNLLLKRKLLLQGGKQWHTSTRAKKQILSMTSDWNVFIVRWLTAKWLFTLATCHQHLHLLCYIQSWWK